ncbi:MAG: hypothetical protein MN733_19415 [Nitrososphaera sp.]|nr:hypothetical protein [Nitrososphaera sp.]
MDQLVAALVGGFLAAGTGWFLQMQLEKSRLKRAKKLLTLGITDDLQQAIHLYDRIGDEWEKSQTIWFSTLIELRESRQTVQNNKDWILVYEDTELRQAIFRYYLKSADRINTLEYQQRRKYEIEEKLNRLVTDIKYRDATLTHEKAWSLAVSLMEAEHREYINLLQTTIPQTVAKLKEFKGEAKEIMSKLQKEMNRL